ncbi:MAG TPA: ribonuclease HII [Verrucomicrobiae bacterium]
MARFWNRLAFERDLWQQGLSHVAGVDEAGCGPLAGPVVAAAVIFPKSWLESGLPSTFRGLNDSKQLTEGEREKFFERLVATPEICHAIATVDVETIDRINIRQAAWHGMNLALDQLQPRPEHVLVDGLRIKWLPYRQTALTKGDARSYSIAAASVLAKVTRDRVMRELDKQFPGYGFAGHKGYSTPQHFAAIEKLGPCAIHRKSFSPIKAKEADLFENADKADMQTKSEPSPLPDPLPSHRMGAEREQQVDAP